jgi:5-methylcytosine-specific restriction endonuclease McrA
MNYQGLQNLYSKPKKKKHSKAKKNKKGIDTKAKVKKAVKEAKKPLTTRKEQYHKELEHPLWLKKRKIILERDNHKCVLCGSTSNLRVHHTRYSDNKKAWEYPNAVLITLCEDCHKKVHSDINHSLNPYKK